MNKNMVLLHNYILPFYPSRYYFNSERMMKNVGRNRPPMDGLHTFEEKVDLKTWLGEIGLDEFQFERKMMNARTDYSANMRWLLSLISIFTRAVWNSS